MPVWRTFSIVPRVAGSYGRWAGVNWVWAVELTIYHAAFSIAIPVLLVSVMFARQRREAWISQRKSYLLLMLWLVNAVFIFCFISSYSPSGLHYLLTVMMTVGLAAVIFLIWMARWTKYIEKSATDVSFVRARICGLLPCSLPTAFEVLHGLKPLDNQVANVSNSLVWPLEI